eukprot:6203779-Pleurochrysis_carterae.AAC.8
MRRSSCFLMCCCGLHLKRGGSRRTAREMQVACLKPEVCYSSWLSSACRSSLSWDNNDHAQCYGLANGIALYPAVYERYTSSYR